MLGGSTLLVAAPMLAACGASGEGATEIPAGRGDGGSLIAAFPQSSPHVPVGVPTRLAYLITDSEGVPLDQISGDVPFVIAKGGKTVAEMEIAPHSEGIPRAYLPLVNTFDSEGIYDVTATYDGTEMTSQLQVFPAKEVISPVVGQQLPSAPTPTLDSPLDVDPICTLVPPCPFHTVNLADVIGSGKPIVLLIATPAYCQTAFCGPTLGNLIDVADGRDDLIVIHAEVYRNPKSADGDLADAPLAPVPDKFGLQIEPVLYVTDAKGKITTRADAMIDRTEMEQALTV